MINMFVSMWLRKIIFFIIITFACLVEGDDSAFSEGDKKKVRDSLYSLWELKKDNGIEQRGKLNQQGKWVVEMGSLSEEIGEWEEMEDLKESDFSKKKEGYDINNASLLVSVFALENSSYVKTLFQNDPTLMEWIKRDPELLFLAIYFSNIDMIQFFVENSQMINVPIESTHFIPFHSAIISRRQSIIEYFLNHPETNLTQKNVWGDNAFHIVFLSGNQYGIEEKGKGEKKMNHFDTLNLLFQPKYFSRMPHLLNTPNDDNETVLDFVQRDEVPNKKDIIQLLRYKGALLSWELTMSERWDKAVKQLEDKAKNGCAKIF